MKTNLIALVALFVFPVVAIGSGLLAERLMGPRTLRKRRARGKSRADKSTTQALPKRGATRG